MVFLSQTGLLTKSAATDQKGEAGKEGKARTISRIDYTGSQ